MNRTEAKQAADFDAFIEDRRLHGDHVIIALPHMRHQIAHPGCNPIAGCELSGRELAPGTTGVFVPELDEHGRLYNPAAEAKR